MKKHIVILRIVSLLFVVSLGLGMGLVASSRSTASLEEESPTAVQDGVMTTQQREHSKLYKNYNSNRKIPDLARKEKGDVEVYRLSPLGADVSAGPTPTTVEILKRAICDSAAVVLGVVKGKSSQLTEDESFVFTDYEIAIEQVLKDNDAAAIRSNGEITFTRPGGTLFLNRKRVRATDESFRPLKVGQQYLLFLEFLPATGTYKSIETGESFEVQKNKIKSLKKESLDRFAIDYEASSLIDQVRLAAAIPCGGGKGGVK